MTCAIDKLSVNKKLSWSISDHMITISEIN